MPMTEPFALYVHWPFCLSKCPYCDFNSHVAEGGVDEGRWRRALLAELDGLAGDTVGRSVTSLFFGGGTPSLMPPTVTADIIAAVHRLWPTTDDMEVTLEANPSSVEAERFRDFRGAGVNRLSLGVQSLDDAALKFLGRGHSVAEARQAIELSQQHFPRTSFDLIHGLPNQTPQTWGRELKTALGLAGGHLSLYQLTIEPGTPFFRDGIPAADGETGADLYDVTRDLTEAAGLPAYEISNHARPGTECRHNLDIWRGTDYGGIGPGAHSRLTLDGETVAAHRIHDPNRWLKAVAATGDGTGKRTALSVEDRGWELIMTGLRLTEGIDRKRFLSLTGRDLTAVVSNNALERMVEGGFVSLDENSLAATPAGMLRLDSVLAGLLA